MNPLLCSWRIRNSDLVHSCVVWEIRNSESPMFLGIGNSEFSTVLFGGRNSEYLLCCLGIRNSEFAPVLFGGRNSESPMFLGIRNSESSPVFLENQKF